MCVANEISDNICVCVVWPERVAERTWELEFLVGNRIVDKLEERREDAT